MSKVNVNRLVVALALIVLICGIGRTVSATGPLGLDVVLIIDQSGSMGGSKKHPTKNDPYSKRVEAVKNLVTFLYDSVEGYHGSHGLSPIHQLAIVEFGTDARTVLRGAEISYQPGESRLDLSQRKNAIINAIQPQSMGNTDHLAAFQEAAPIISEMAAANLPGPRKQLLILLTDGQSYRQGFTRGPYQTQMARYIKTNLLDRKVVVEVVGLDAGSNYWDRGAGAYWNRATNGHARKINDHGQFYQAFTALLKKYLPSAVDSQEVGDRFDCPPYLKRMIINVDKNVPGSSIILYDPQNRRIDLAALKSHNTPTFARYYLTQPPPGVYRVERPMGSKSCDVEFELYYSEVKLLAPLRPVNRMQNVQIGFRVSSENGRPFELQAQYPVRAEIKVTDPEGNEVPVLPVELKDQGVFSTRTDFVPQKHGDYKIQLFGFSRTLAGRDVVIFKSRALKLLVLDREPLALKVLKPALGEKIRLFFGRGEVRVEASLHTMGANPKLLPPDQACQNPAGLLEVELLDSREERIGPKVFMEVMGDGFAGLIPVALDWSDPRSWAFWRDDYYIRLIPHDQALKTDYFIHSRQGK